MNDRYANHEALHTTYILMENVDRYLCEHSYIKDNADCRELAEKAAEILGDLYQLIGNQEGGE